MTPDDAVALRSPFAQALIEYKTINGRDFGYINHALVTDRLIQVDPAWTWLPMATDECGMPKLDSHGGLWIRLSILGVTRIGYGASEPHQKGADAIKTAISDAIKNAAMRFGVALDLWMTEVPETSLAVVRSIPSPPMDQDPWALESTSRIEINQDILAGSCEHGERQYKAAKDGKWAAYFCPEKAEGCQPLDAKTGKIWPAKK